MTTVRVCAGRPSPLGVQDRHDGFNFSVYSRHAERVELLIFEDATSESPLAVIDLSAPEHRTGDVWHALVGGLRWGQAYAYRAFGRWAPVDGKRFDGAIELLDPRALAVWIDPCPTPGRRRHRSLLVDQSFDWQGTTHPRRAWSETLIYETHVRGLTIESGSGVAHRGTFLGVAEKLPYLQELGITAIELMPVQAFDDILPTGRDPSSGLPLFNYWGYNPIALFAPHSHYASTHEPGSELREFKTMMRDLHRNGIEVILDIVFTHTAEGGDNGPTFSLRGLDDSIYYLHGNTACNYLDYSGCGNTLNCNHPVVRDYIMDCLRYWRADMQVDGFRFDLASILGRDEHGGLLSNAPLLECIAQDPILRGAKLIAEAWDVGGAYQVGCFAGSRWAEWNGCFRDDVRRFWRGDPGMAGAFARRICGSPDLYSRTGKAPINSINFVASHDGFTLNDIVTYTTKRNLANGENNRDGPDDSYSANYGVEGDSKELHIEQLRLRQIKNMLATLAISRGVPMLLGGDEFRRTQLGNNNPYCQDNAVSWHDWGLVERNAELVRFTKKLFEWRRRSPVLSADAFYAPTEMRWFAPSGADPDWEKSTHAFGCVIDSPLCKKGEPDAAAGQPDANTLCLLFNASEAAVAFRLPAVASCGWHLVMDTSLPPPRDILDSAQRLQIDETGGFTLGARALALLCCGAAAP
ncbi:glycogen debranching protein [Paraburkholderia azotifigens]|uniref:Glycogen-debranching protein n=1 Tax=Paraburkholderia azotifigens TaxID=2057004 RepID=A0A5C6V790_9BURK|nr:isoamylase [Paraburkholderia azotifigens]TXC79625.1 glycogen-debranching protein [Paraburkholderia azotifigens]